MHQLFTVFVIVTMSSEHLALMVCPEDKYLANGTSSCFCNGTNPRWEKEGDHYVNQIKHSNSSVEIVLVCNSNDSDLTFTCCVNDSETGLDVCNETFTLLFAYPVLTVNNKQYYNGSVVSLSATSHHNLSCAIEEEFLSIDEVLLSCEGVFENRPVRSRDNVTLATIGCSTVCSCRAKQGTGCYQLASSVTFSVTTPLRMSNPNLTTTFSMAINSMFYHTLQVTGCPQPSHLSVVTNGHPVDQMRHNISCYLKVSSGDLALCNDPRFAEITEATIELSIGPLTDDYFTNYTLVLSNESNTSLKYDFSLVRTKDTDDEVILPLVIGLSVSIGLVCIAVFTAVIVLIIRSSTRRKRRASVRDRYSQDSANRQIRTKAYRLARSLADTNCQVGIKSTDQEKDATSSRLPGSGRSWSLPDLYMPGNTVTNRQYSRRQQIRPGHLSVSSDLADCNDDAIISAHLPHLLFDVTMDTTPELPAKLGKLKYGAKRESVYDTPPDRDFKISENLNEKISEVKNRNVQNKHFTEERLSELVACQVLTTDPGNQIEIPSEHPTVCTQLQIPSQHPTVCTQLQIPLEQPTDQYDRQLEQATSLNNQSEIPSEHLLSLCDQHEISLEHLTSLLEIFPIEQHPVTQNQQEKIISMELPIILSSEPLEAPHNVKPGTKVSIITDYTNEDLTNSGYENIVINK
uniref:Ig-like domain-containing protein n=1 Tax=Biomphalaria glabrata TaxID=6526 RepID=A0A2C9KBW9_BIOGL